MSRTTSVQLKGHFADFVEEQTASGRYASADEVVEAGLALLEHRAEPDDRDALDFGQGTAWTRETLEEAIRKGEESGPAGPFDVEEFFSAMRRKIAARQA